jgi:hypothetical protein
MSRSRRLAIEAPPTQAGCALLHLHFMRLRWLFSTRESTRLIASLPSDEPSMLFDASIQSRTSPLRRRPTHVPTRRKRRRSESRIFETDDIASRVPAEHAAEAQARYRSSDPHKPDVHCYICASCGCAALFNTRESTRHIAGLPSDAPWMLCDASPQSEARAWQTREYRDCATEKRKPRSSVEGASGLVDKPGNDLLSHARARAVPSALEGLTSEFEMGSGMAPPTSSPEKLLVK